MKYGGISAGATVVAVLLGSDVASADEHRFIPTASVQFGGTIERLSIDRGAAGAQTETRSDLRLSLALGLVHPVWTLSPRAAIEGHLALGFGPTFRGGHYQLPLRDDVTFAYAVRPWLVLRAGVGAGVVVDATDSATSFAELGIPVGVTLLRTFDVVYRPYLSIPLGQQETAVFGGTREYGAALGLVPIDFAVRVRIRALGFR